MRRTDTDSELLIRGSSSGQRMSAYPYLTATTSTDRKNQTEKTVGILLPAISQRTTSSTNDGVLSRLKIEKKNVPNLSAFIENM